MIRISSLEEIQGLLLRLPRLVALQERRDAEFVGEVKRWLLDLEEAFTRNRIPEAGGVATLRGLLISAERGAIPDGVELLGRPTHRRIREASAAELLRRGHDVAAHVIRLDRERVADAERLCRQLVAVAKSKGFLSDLPSIGPHYGDALKGKWRVLSSDPDMAVGTLNVEGLVGPTDALIILDRTISSDLVGA